MRPQIIKLFLFNSLKKYFFLPAFLISFSFSNLFSQAWTSTGIGVENTTADFTCVYSMITYNNELYIGGCFTSVNGVPANYIAKFDGTNWSALGNGLWHTGNNAIIYSGVRSMAVYNGELYASGLINQSGTTTINSVAKWNGSTWVAIGGTFGVFDGVLSLCVYNNELYAGGHMGNGYNSFAKWNGSSWIPLGTGLALTNGTMGLVRDLKVFNNLLYIGGQFDSGDGIISPNLIVFNGSNYTSIGAGVNGAYGVSKLGIFNNDLIVDGGFLDINGIPFNNIARYDNTSWNSLSTGTGLPGGTSYESQPILEYNNKLFVAGSFGTAGSIPVNNIAQWDGISWQTVGTGTNGFVGALAIFQNELYAAGKFTTAGGLSVNNIAKWTEQGAGINETDFYHSFSVYPNPFFSQTTLHSSENLMNATLTVENSLGQTVSQEENINGQTVVINRHHLVSGVYFIRLTTAGKIYTQRLVITDR